MRLLWVDGVVQEDTIDQLYKMGISEHLQGANFFLARAPGLNSNKLRDLFNPQRFIYQQDRDCKHLIINFVPNKEELDSLRKFINSFNDIGLLTVNKSSSSYQSSYPSDQPNNPRIL